MLRFDKYIHKEMSGQLRLLFEEGSSYIYVWVTRAFEITAFQYLISGITGLQYYETGAVKVNTLSRQPFNRALTGASAVSDKDAIEQLARLESQEIPSLVPLLAGLARKEITKAKLSCEAQKFISKFI